MNDLWIIVFLIFFGQTAGSLIGLIKKPSKKFLYASLAFAGSMMLSISFFQLIPEGLKIAPLYLIFISFFAGMIMMRATDHVLPHINPQLLKKEKPSVKRSTAMLVIGMAMHNLPEGLATGVGFALNPSLGIMIALGIAAHDIPENIATIVPLYSLTKKRMKSFVIVMGTIVFELIGFILGYYFLTGTALNLLGASLALAAGFMTYISIEELIPSAKIKENFKAGIIALALGVVFVLLITFLGF